MQIRNVLSCINSCQDKIFNYSRQRPFLFIVRSKNNKRDLKFLYSIFLVLLFPAHSKIEIFCLLLKKDFIFIISLTNHFWMKKLHDLFWPFDQKMLNLLSKEPTTYWNSRSAMELTLTQTRQFSKLQNASGHGS